MRIVAILYVVLSVSANFFYGNLTTFVLAAFSFPLLVWLLVRKQKKARVNAKETELNSPAAS